ncbi:hypothetical protein UU5_06360 [Rhodanobacter sp. 115]|nr:hypothetical protein UU5_06360 [Rhodanobacter sp. 115]
MELRRVDAGSIQGLAATVDEWQAMTSVNATSRWPRPSFAGTLAASAKTIHGRAGIVYHISFVLALACTPAPHREE